MNKHPQRALIIFAKRPVAGQVKTRLTPPLSPEEAAELYGCMLGDVLDKAGRLPDVVPFLYYQHEPAAAGFFRAEFPHLSSRPQRGADLGERMANAFRELFDEGFQKVAIIGTDLPDLPLAHILQSYDLLDRRDIDTVYGPSEDGGYYLLGLKRVWPELFAGIPWSTAEVLRLSLARTEAIGARTALLPVWHDVDTIEDLERPELRDERNEAPRTREFIESLLKSKIT